MLPLESFTSRLLASAPAAGRATAPYRGRLQFAKFALVLRSTFVVRELDLSIEPAAPAKSEAAFGAPLHNLTVSLIPTCKHCVTRFVPGFRIGTRVAVLGMACCFAADE